MDLHNLIHTAIENKWKTLSEFESKQVLSAYGIPVAREYLTGTPDQAMDRAEELGFPVVLKTCSREVLHKTEKGLVQTNLACKADVGKAFDAMWVKTDGRLDGILVQEMVIGAREMMIGLIRDRQFGPCVMVGFGGILTEIINDSCFRMAPVDMLEASDMLDTFRSKEMLGPYRGKASVDREGLCKAICRVGDIGMDYPEIAEIDINPLIIRPDGNFAAVDALIVLKGGTNA